MKKIFLIMTLFMLFSGESFAKSKIKTELNQYSFTEINFTNGTRDGTDLDYLNNQDYISNKSRPTKILAGYIYDPGMFSSNKVKMISNAEDICKLYDYDTALTYSVSRIISTKPYNIYILGSDYSRRPSSSDINPKAQGNIQSFLVFDKIICMKSRDITQRKKYISDLENIYKVYKHYGLFDINRLPQLKADLQRFENKQNKKINANTNKKSKSQYFDEYSKIESSTTSV